MSLTAKTTDDSESQLVFKSREGQTYKKLSIAGPGLQSNHKHTSPSQGSPS